MQQVVSRFNKEHTMLKLSASRKRRYIESEHKQTGPLAGVSVPDAGTGLLKLHSDIAVKFGDEWRVGQVERIFKKHSKGTAECQSTVPQTP